MNLWTIAALRFDWQWKTPASPQLQNFWWPWLQELELCCPPWSRRCAARHPPRNLLARWTSLIRRGSQRGSEDRCWPRQGWVHYGARILGCSLSEASGSAASRCWWSRRSIASASWHRDETLTTSASCCPKLRLANRALQKMSVLRRYFHFLRKICCSKSHSLSASNPWRSTLVLEVLDRRQR